MAIDVAGIPHKARPLWDKLMAEEVIPVHQLFSEVTEYRKAIEAARRMEHVDDTLADALADVSLQLLQTIGPNTTEETRRVIQGAVRYFVLEDDIDGDLDSVLGFDDDAEVMNAALDHLGRSEWHVDTP